MSGPSLRLTIDFAGFYVDGSESAEDIEQTMDLATDNVIVVFQGHEGDEAGPPHLRHLEGHIVKFEVVS